MDFVLQIQKIGQYGPVIESGDVMFVAPLEETVQIVLIRFQGVRRKIPFHGQIADESLTIEFLLFVIKNHLSVSFPSKCWVSCDKICRFPDYYIGWRFILEAVDGLCYDLRTISGLKFMLKSLSWTKGDRRKA